MGEILQIFLTSSLTIVGGVFIYTTGEVLSRFIIEPIHEQRKLIGEISDTLIYYANIFYHYTSIDSKAEKAEREIRSLSTRLRAKTGIIPLYSTWEKLKWVPTERDISKATTALIGLSNSVYGKGGHDHVEAYRKEISEALDIDVQ